MKHQIKGTKLGAAKEKRQIERERNRTKERNRESATARESEREGAWYSLLVLGVFGHALGGGERALQGGHFLLVRAQVGLRALRLKERTRGADGEGRMKLVSAYSAREREGSARMRAP